MGRGRSSEHIGLDAVLGQCLKQLVALDGRNSVVLAAIQNNERHVVFINEVQRACKICSVKRRLGLFVSIRILIRTARISKLGSQVIQALVFPGISDQCGSAGSRVIRCLYISAGSMICGL